MACMHYLKARQVQLKGSTSVLDLDGEFLWSGAEVGVQVRPGMFELIA